MFRLLNLLRPHRVFTIAASTRNAKTNISNLYVRRSAKIEPGYDEQVMKSMIMKAMRSAPIQRGVQKAHGTLQEGVVVVIMRAVADFSKKGEKDPHFTAWVFRAAGKTEHLGGVHVFPPGLPNRPSFPSSAESRRLGFKKWLKKTFKDVKDVQEVA